MHSLPSRSKDIVPLPAPGRVASRRQMPVAVRALRLVPALFASPSRALFTAGVALGLLSPRLFRAVATRALTAALGPGSVERRGHTDKEIVVERYFASRVVIRRRQGG